MHFYKNKLHKYTKYLWAVRGKNPAEFTNDAEPFIFFNICLILA